LPFDPVQLKQNDYVLAVNKAQLAMEESLAKVGLRDCRPDFDCSKVPTVVKASAGRQRRARYSAVQTLRIAAADVGAGLFRS
jgi:hypothetical protein